MDKLKNILPGKHKDDQTMYGSKDNSGGPHSEGVLTGEGSHLKQDNSSQGPNTGSMQNTSQTTQPSRTDVPGGSVGQPTSQAAGDSSMDQTRQQRVSQDEKPMRQNMPGKFPSENTMSESHNPYTSHELDPRIGGSTIHDNQAEASGRDNSNEQSTDSSSQLKGLNATRKEDYSRDDQRMNEPPIEKLTSRDNTPFVAGGAAATAAALGQQSQTRQSAGTGGNVGNTYTGTTPSGSNSNYYGPPTGTAVAGGQRGQNEGGPLTEGQYSSTGQPQYEDNQNAPTTNPDDNQHHTLRNAAVGAGAAGIGAHAYQNRETHDQTSNTRYAEREGYQPSSTQAQQDTYSSQHAPARSYNDNTTGSQRAPVDQYSTSDRDRNDGHALRNTAIGAGAAGVGAHEYREHRNKEDAYNTHADDNFRNQTTSTGSQQAPVDQYSTSDRDKNDSHAMRNTAIGAGAAGVGAHEYREHRNKEDAKNTHADDNVRKQTTSADSEPHTTGPHHKSKLLNMLDPRVHSSKKADDTADTQHTSDRRRSAEAPVTGAALGSDRHAEKHTDKPRSLDDPTYRAAGTGHHVELPPGVELPKGNHYGKQVEDPRYGLGLEHAGLTAEEAAALRRGEYDPGANKLRKEKPKDKDDTHGTTKEKKRRSSLLGFLHRDKNKKYTQEEEDEFARQEREHNARTGLTGAAATHSADQTSSNTNKPLPADPSYERHGDMGQNRGPIHGQQMDLTDRTRQSDNTTGAYGGATHGRDERPLDTQRETTGKGYTGGNDNTLASTYPGDGRDYPVGDSSRGAGYNDTSAPMNTQQSTGYGDDYQQNTGSGTNDGGSNDPRVADRAGNNVLHKKGLGQNNEL